MSNEGDDSSDLSSGGSIVDDEIAAVDAILATRQSWQRKSLLLSYTLPVMKTRPVRRRKRYALLFFNYILIYSIISLTMIELFIFAVLGNEICVVQEIMR